MTGIEIDVSEAQAALAEFHEGMMQHHAAHFAQTPDFPAAAAGKGFSEYGAALAEMFAAVHKQAGTCAVTLLEAISVAHGDVGTCADNDTTFAHDLRSKQ